MIKRSTLLRQLRNLRTFEELMLSEYEDTLKIVGGKKLIGVLSEIRDDEIRHIKIVDKMIEIVEKSRGGK